MTLTKAIEAARDDFKNVDGTLMYIETQLKGSLIHSDVVIRMNAESGRRRIKQALAALPDKPMTEEGMIELCKNKYPRMSVSMILGVIRALKAANVLYCEEK